MLKHTAKALAAALFLSFAFAEIAHAQYSEYIHEPRTSARVMGMGGAFTALADDYNALYYNPAGLARRDKGELNLQLTAGLTPTLLNFYNSLSTANGSASTITNLLQSNYGAHYSSRVGLGGTYVGQGWGFGIQPIDVTVEMGINNDFAGAIALQAYNDTLAQFGLGWKVGKSFSFGIAPKAVYRAFIEKEVLALDLVQSTNILKTSDATEGLTVDGDIGTMYTFDVPESWWFKPSLAFVVRNVVNEGFVSNLHLYSGGSSNITNPDGYLGRRFDIGTRFELPEFWSFKPRYLLDFRDLGNQYATFTKCLHTGIELPWKASDLVTGAYRIGYSEGYFTAGFSFDLIFLTLDIATYSEEIGTSNAPVESRRYMAQFSMDF
jgi:hypothetical protein